MKSKMVYICSVCSDVHSFGCEHSSLHKRPCYSTRSAGLWSGLCDECIWKFVCATDGDLLDAQYLLNASIVQSDEYHSSKVKL